MVLGGYIFFCVGFVIILLTGNIGWGRLGEVRRKEGMTGDTPGKQSRFGRIMAVGGGI